MTEYDYSPEAYQRYMATQQRIAKWVDKTERHRPEFEHAVPTSPNQQNTSGSGWRNLFKRSPSPSSSRKQRPADIYVPPPESESDDGYYDHHSGSSHGPSPPPSAGMMVPHQQAIYHTMGQPMLSPPMMVPQAYIQPAPHHHSSSSHRKHHSSRSHSRSRSHHSPGYYTLASPPVSPGYQYAFPSPPPMGGAPAGPYIMMPPQPNGHPGAHIMPNTHQALPRSAPPSVAAISSAPPTPTLGGNVAPDYFHNHHSRHRPKSRHHQPIPRTAMLAAQQYQQLPAASPYSSIAAVPVPAGSWATYGLGSPSHSMLSVSPPPSSSSPYYVAVASPSPNSSSPMLQPGFVPGAMAVQPMPMMMAAVPLASHPQQHLTPPPSFQPFVMPAQQGGLHPRVYDLGQAGGSHLYRSHGRGSSNSKHHHSLRHSVG